MEMGLVNGEVESKEDFKKRKANEKKEAIREVKLHGQLEKETEEIKTEMSWNWLTKGDLKRETESLLIAAQDQALHMNLVKRDIYNMGETNKCRLCGEKLDSVIHLVSACKMLAQREYKRRHDKVYQCLHWLLCVKSTGIRSVTTSTNILQRGFWVMQINLRSSGTSTL